MTSRLFGLAGFLVPWLIVALVASPATAGKVEKKLGGKIMLSEKRFPTKAKSENAFISKVKKQSKAKFQENKANKEWKIHFAAFFKKPLPDLEYSVKVWDLTDGSKDLVKSWEQYADSQSQTTVLSYLTLNRDETAPNRKLMVTIEALGKVVAVGKFQILGEVEKHSGKVDFSNDTGEDE